MKRSDYLEKRNEIMKDCDEKLAALDKVFVMFGGTPVGTSGNEAVAASDGGWTFDVSKREAVRLAIKDFSGQFTSKQVRLALEKDYPEYSKQITDNQLSATLSNFAFRKEILVHRKKLGQSPAIYEIKARGVGQD